MKTKAAVLGMGFLGLAIAASVAANDRDGRFRVAAALKPSSEIPAISSTARGSFKATIDTDNELITYELRYSGIATPLFAHIHFGQPFANGGVSVFLCANTGTFPAGTPACPASDTTEATVTGTLTPASIVGPGGQGITTGEFEELIAAIRRGLTYANVHSSTFQPGEIRGQLERADKQ